MILSVRLIVHTAANSYSLRAYECEFQIEKQRNKFFSIGGIACAYY